MHSCLYEGTVRHCRSFPKKHQFNFRFFMVMLDLDEIDSVFRSKWFYSSKRFSLAEFRASDHLKRYTGVGSLKSRAQQALVEHGIDRNAGQIKLLTQLRYLGWEMNPISLFYCYEENTDNILAIIAEVNNTPWGEQHVYVVSPEKSNTKPKHTGSQKSIHSSSIEKVFHVSPFMSLAMKYQMAFSVPGKRLAVRIANHINDDAPDVDSESREHDRILNVTMLMQKQEWSASRLNWMLIRYPLASLQVFAAIYWQAFRLYLKGITFFPHPRNQVQTQTTSSLSNQAADQNTHFVEQEIVGQEDTFVASS